MKVKRVDEIRFGMVLAQNIYRHDGLLLLPKGVRIHKFEKDSITSNQIEYILIEEFPTNKKQDLQLTFSIIENAFYHTTLWERSVGRDLYQEVYKRVKRNKKVQLYLDELRMIDSYSFVQCINVSIVVGALTKIENKVDKDLVDMVYLALLHDVGRIKIKKILSKEFKLTDEEFRELQKHPFYSFELLKKAGFMEIELRGVLEHHEKYNGSGYPMRLEGDEISDFAQIIQIADVYNALLSPRPYRPAYDPYHVYTLIQEEKGRSFGDKHVDFFLQKFTPYPAGTTVELNNGKVAVVRAAKHTQKFLPKVEILGEKQIIDLAVRPEIKIVRVLTDY